MDSYGGIEVRSPEPTKWKKPMAGSTGDVTSKLDAIAADIAAGRIGQSEPWGGADVVISAHPAPAKSGEGFYPAPRFVVTPHVAELSWLFESLRDAFTSVIDYQSKYEFYGRLADAADRHAAGSVGDMLAGVLGEARVMAGEFGGSE